MSITAARNIQTFITSLNNSFYAYLMQHHRNSSIAIERGNCIKAWAQTIAKESTWRLSLFKGIDVQHGHNRQEFFKLLCEY